MAKCEHRNLHTACRVGLAEDTGRRMADITITCLDCKKPMQFLGLPVGLNFNGAAVSPDGTEVRLAICVQGEQANPIQALMGYTIN